MIRKPICLFIVSLMLISLFPAAAFAAEGTISAGGTYDLSAYGNGSTITINPGLSVTLTNTSGTEYADIQVVCGEGVTLTIDGVKIKNTVASAVCPIVFAGTGNILILRGSNLLQGGSACPGVKCETGCGLEICGDGSLEAHSCGEAAAIGGSKYHACGNIKISDGTINAYGEFGPGIGSGSETSTASGTIEITGGEIYAYSYLLGAGIGGAYQDKGGSIIISGGEVSANGTTGIGSGSSTNPAFNVSITGGVINAYGNSAGIGGGGSGSPAGNVSISGGFVWAQGTYDIGPGSEAEGGSFSISGDAAVLLGGNQCPDPSTTTHTFHTYDTADNIYGIPRTDLINVWNRPVSAWINESCICDVRYDINGGTGSAPAATEQYKNTTATIADGGGICKGEERFLKWNTQPDGTGTGYAPGDNYTISSDTTLYAVYFTPVRVTSVDIGSDAETIMDGEYIDLHAVTQPADATYPEIVWTSSDESVAVVDNNGRVTAVHAGSAVITAAADGKSDTCGITVLSRAAYTVTFDWQDGGDKTTVQADTGGKVEENSPEREGYTFIGWYKDTACMNPWNFNDDVVTDDLTLYALWTKDGYRFSGGGTQTNPYHITSAAELAELSALVNAGNADYTDKYYIQTQDIDLSGYSGWTPIGTNVTGSMFSGTYDGYGNSITNLSITNGSGYTGLFGYVSGSVKNLNVENGSISINSGNATAGTIAGCVYNGSIQNCNVKMLSINVSNGNALAIGGVTGNTTGSIISGCSFNGSISVAGFGAHSGGITGEISGNATAGSAIEDCISAGSISSENTSYSYLGGIAGWVSSDGHRSSIETCSNSQVIQAQGDLCYCGGISGYCAYTDISDCYNAANIISGLQNDWRGAGGVIGNGINSTVKNCYNMGGVQGYYRGGVAGFNYDSSITITNCYYLDTCSLAVGSGVGTANRRSPDEMKQQSTYSGFDFGSVWTLDEAEETGYPYPQLKGGLFYPQTHEVTLTADDTMGTLQGAGAYKPFETVTITALPKEHYTFKNWAVSAGGAFLDNTESQTTTFSMPTSGVSISAFFEKKKYDVEFEYEGSGTASGGGSYTWGETVSITAKADSGEQFLYWDVLSGGIEIPDKFDMTTTFVMPKSDVNIKAVFGENPPEFSYTVADEKATITGYTGTGGAVEIPTRLGGYWVTAIGKSAFLESGLEYVEIPDCVEQIGEFAFYHCKKLSRVYIGSGVKSVGMFAFSNCYALQNFDVSEDNDNFCSADGVLYNKDETELVVYPPGRLGPYSVPQGVKSIAPAAFHYCTLLTGISMPDSVISIGKYAFCGTGIGNVTIPPNVDNIEDYAFNTCTSLQNVVFGGNVKYIGKYAFQGCSGIRQLYLPEPLAAIYDYAFLYCSQLSDVYFWGNRPGVFASNAFDKCNNPQIYYHVSKVGSWAAAGKKAFCVLTLEQGEDLGNVTQNAVLDGFKLIKPADPQCEDYAFAGWYADSECSVPYNFDNTVTDDIKLYAKWALQKFIISYDLGGGSLSASNPSYYRTSGGAITLRNPVKTGYTFEGWSGTDIDGVSATVTIPSGSTGDRNYVAHWIANTYTITFNSREGSFVPTADVKYGSLVTEPPAPSRQGYSFAGWYKEASCINSWNFKTDIVSGSDTLYAKWTPLKYSITYDLAGGSLSAPNPAYYSTGDGAVTLHNPVRTGYTFAGWSETGLGGVSKTVTIPSGSTGDRHYAANWTVNTYTITFNPREGSYVPAADVEYGSLINEPSAPSKPGYSFAGWYTEASCINRWDFLTDIVTSSDTLYARWEPFSCLLDDIELSAGTLMKPFAKNTTGYNITLGEYEESLKLVPVKEYSGAVMKINNIVRDSLTVSLANGRSATVSVSVSFNKKTKNYTFKIARVKSSNNALSSLAATAGSFDRPFDPNVLNYTLSLGEYTSNVTINAAAAPGAGVSPSSKKLALNNGAEKTVKITVKAQTGAKRTYVITVRRAGATNANLKILKTSPGLSPAFSPWVTSYTVLLPANKGSASVSVKAAGYKAAIYIDGAKKSSKKVTVPGGQSVTVRVTVAAQAGNTKDYYITFTRPSA